MICGERAMAPAALDLAAVHAATDAASSDRSKKNSARKAKNQVSSRNPLGGTKSAKAAAPPSSSRSTTSSKSTAKTSPPAGLKKAKTAKLKAGETEADCAKRSSPSDESAKTGSAAEGQFTGHVPFRRTWAR